MFNTEKYEVLFTGVDSMKFNLSEVSHNWRLAAYKVYRELGLYIGALFAEAMVVCDDPNNFERTIVAALIRNPISEPNADHFYGVLQQVVNLTSYMTGNIRVNMIRTAVEVNLK